ncbi:Crp/Fnr family transcriptional regulator [Microvirga lenta]|uniref:Crp/Fnr family transcriptional regulator n=1 Tax=Microvirga lenta TaxID=2881337 RepID=UPI001CFF95C8|nr:Crp/Fnr family transcriptional regulator [Microvirga lenta]MCB5175860.1 Crp/Fnr family transcriptional regulator [Microvirga lenta]
MAEPRNLTALLGANPFFASLGSEAIQAIALLCLTRHLDREEVLFFKGDAGDALYAVRRGQIRIGTGLASGRRLTLNLLGPGDVFGEVALLDGRPRTADAVATEPTELYVVRRRDFLDLLATKPDVAVRIIEFLCERIRWMSGQMEERALLPLPIRLAHRLVALSEDYGCDLHVSQEELAIFIGATRESVNRQLQTWRRQGLVELSRNRIRVLQPSRLSTPSEDGTKPDGTV